MKQNIIAKTKYKEGYWLVWETGFNDVHKKYNDQFTDKAELKNDIQVTLKDDKGKYLGDAICHYGSYGVENGEWEIMIDSLPKNWGDSVKGYLTWKEVEYYFDKKIKSLTPKRGKHD